MTRDVEDMLARAREVFDRIPVGPEQTAARLRQVQRGVVSFGRRLLRAFGVAGTVALAALLYSIFFTPIGISGFLLTLLVMAATWFTVLLWPGKKPPKPAELVALPAAALPARTDAFLTSRRRVLPALAAPKLDSIASQLAALEPQLQRVEANDPVAQDLQRLLGRHLPEFVDSYARVPPAQRDRDMDRQLVDSLAVVETELARASQALASGDKDAFLTRGRFLETRYGKEGADGD